MITAPTTAPAAGISANPVEMVLSHVANVRQNGTGWNGSCPACGDTDHHLHIANGDDGRVLMNCKHGCDFRQIVAALGLTEADLFPRRTAPVSNADPIESLARLRGWTPESIKAMGGEASGSCVKWPVVDRNGKITGRKSRRGDGRPFANGKKTLTGKGEHSGLHVPKQWHGDGPLLIVEGIADACAASSHGWTGDIVATDGANIVKAARLAIQGRVHSRDIIASPDPDDAGVKTWLPDLAQLCRNAGCASFRYIMPDAKTGDIDKRLRAGELLVDMIQAAAPWAAPAQAGGDGMMVANGQPISLADHFLTTCYSMKTRPTLYRHRGDFHTWNKCAYQTLSDEALSAQLYRHLEGLSVITPEGPRPIIPKANLISEIIKALPSRNILLPDDFETPGWLDRKDHPRPADLVACHNGLLHLPTLTLHEPTPVFFNQTSVDCDFDPGAAFPSAWIAFLTDLWGSDEESISLLQEWFGYLISPDTSQHKIGVIIGPPRSGKGTLARVARSILGERSTCGPTLGALAEGFGLQCLIGKSLAIIADARLGGRSDAAAITERLVSISGEDALNVPRKHQVDWYGKLLARFWIMTNEIPRFTDSSGALASRLLVWRLIRSFLGHEDHHLLDRLLAEKDSIFLWAVEGWQRLNARGYFIQPSSAADLCESISDLTSPVLAFIRECCHVNPLSDVSTKELFDAWTKWNREMGREHVGSAQVFGRDLRAALPQVEIKQYRVGSERLRYWTGIGLGQE